MTEQSNEFNDRLAWSQYEQGLHFKTRDETPKSLRLAEATSTSTNPVIEALVLLDLTGEDAAFDKLESFIENSKPEEAGTDLLYWTRVEHAALVKGEGSATSSKWSARVKALEALPVQDEPASNTSSMRLIAEGRRYLHLSEALLRSSLVSENPARMSAAFDKAENAFKSLEDHSYLVASLDVVRGRAASWQNNLPEAISALTSALSEFSALGNLIRTAEISYELGVAQLDLNRPEPAEQLLTRSVNIYAELGTNASRLARSLQSRARARIAKAKLARENRYDITQAARQDALDAFYLATTGDPMQQKGPYDPTERSKLVRGKERAPDDFRAAMAARDLAEIVLVRARSTTKSPSHIEVGDQDQAEANAWLKLACAEYGLEKTIESNSGLSALLSASGSKFAIRRLAQMEYTLLSFSNPHEGAIALVSAGKLFVADRQNSYAIECWMGAADAFLRVAAKIQSRSEAADEDKAAGAEQSSQYWRYRASRLAASIGYRLQSSTFSQLQRPVSGAQSKLHELIDRAAEDMKASFIRPLYQSENAVSAEVFVNDYNASMKLTTRLDTEALSDQHLEKLRDIAKDRGDIPILLKHQRTVSSNTQGLSFLEDLPYGTTLANALNSETDNQERLSLLSRLCRTVSLLHEVFEADVALSIDPEKIIIEPGARCVLQHMEPLHGPQALSPAWRFLYVSSQKTKASDYTALAKLIRLALKGDANAALPSRNTLFWRKVFGLKSQAFDKLPPDLGPWLKSLEAGHDNHLIDIADALEA